MTQVVHCKKEPYDVYIGRPSIFGNPFIIGKDGNREDVINKYRQWIRGEIRVKGINPPTIEQIQKLKNKVLGCWCAPKPCHGDVLVEIINEFSSH